jgi:ribosomal protein S18 acetylase RimI-like enzyme
VEGICEAEKAGTDRLSYCRIFDLDECDFHDRLASMLREDLEGQELCISGFLVAVMDDEPVGAVAAWIEGASGAPSSILKANLLLQAIDRDRMRAAQRHFRKLADLTIPRDEGALQIESVYVRPRGRGRGIAGRLIQCHLAELGPAAVAGKAQVILTATNQTARSAYVRSGFRPSAERWSSDESLLSLVPSLGKLLMERSIVGEQ